MKSKTAKKPTRKKESAPVEIHEAQVLDVRLSSQLPVLNNTPDMLMSLAIQNGTMNIDVLERLSKLQQEWLDRQAKTLFLVAKTNFQSEVPTMAKSKNVNWTSKAGDVINYYFSPLGKIAHALKPYLKPNGLSYEWAIDDFDDPKGIPKIRVTCEVSHIAGHSKSTKMESYHDNSGNKNAIQARASTVSYLQRYTMIAALGLSTDDVDDDGQKGGGAPPAEPDQKKQKGPAPTKDKPAIPIDLMNKAIIRIKNGEDIIAECKLHYTLTKAQLKALNDADNIRISQLSETP